MHHTKHDKEEGLAINKALEYIQANPGRDLSLRVLAKVSNYSPFHFHRLFTEQTGTTPRQYIIKLRLEKMALLLYKNKDQSITDLALESGFASLSTFSRAFKKFYGVSAGEFRKNPETNYRKICKTDRKKGKV